MKNLLQCFVVLFAAYTFAAGQVEQKKTSIADLAWLAGCWENNGKNPTRDEVWTKPAGGSMLGVGRAVVGGKMTEYEFMRIHEENGELLYTAKPSGQPEASFTLISLKDGEAVFENPKHDFPQRVIYRLNEGGSLLARIEGEMNGKKRGIDFPFIRAKCD